MTAMSPAPEAIVPSPRQEPKARDLRVLAADGPRHGAGDPARADRGRLPHRDLRRRGHRGARRPVQQPELVLRLRRRRPALLVPGRLGRLQRPGPRCGRLRLLAPAHAGAVGAADLRRARRHARVPRRPVQHRRHRPDAGRCAGRAATSASPATCPRASTSSPLSAPAMLAAAVWGGIVGVLKAQTGAHEVITTIMLNQVARFTVLYFLAKEAFQRPGSDNLLSPPPNDSATYPTLFGAPPRHPARPGRGVRSSGGCSNAAGSGSRCGPSAPTPTRPGPPA